MQVQQFRLTRKTWEGTTHLITWLECDRRLQPNTIITLKEYPGEDWIIEQRFGVVQDVEDVKKDWDNNHRRDSSDRNVVSKIK